MLTESHLSPEDAIYDHTVRAGDHWMHRIHRGQIFRIVDLEGNQAADTLFYNADDPEERYSASDTIRHQCNLYLTTGTRLMSTEGNTLLTIVADTCGRHDTAPVPAKATRCGMLLARSRCMPAATVFSAGYITTGTTSENATLPVTSIFS